MFMNPELLNVRDDCFEFLDNVRESGAVNMMHGPSLLRESFGFDRLDAWEMFNAWVETKNNPTTNEGKQWN